MHGTSRQNAVRLISLTRQPRFLIFFTRNRLSVDIIGSAHRDLRKRLTSSWGGRKRKVKPMSDYSVYLKQLQSGDHTRNRFLEFMGMTLEELKDGYARFSLQIKEDFMQGGGVMQGGLIVAMADETMAHAIMTVLNPHENIVTVELKNNFIAPAIQGALAAEATVFRKGRSLVIADCLVTDGTGQIISRATSTFLIRRA